MDSELRFLRKISPTFSTGGGGEHFESQILACFIALMSTKGSIPVLHGFPLVEIIPQVRRHGCNTDDIIVIVEDSQTNEKRKLICQVKHSVSVSEKNKDFSEFITSAWFDYKNGHIFQMEKDAFALVTSLLSKTDARNVTSLLEKARLTNDTDSFLKGLDQSGDMKEKYKIIRDHIIKADNGIVPKHREIHDFLRYIHVLQFDLGGTVSVNLSLILSHLSQCCQEDPELIWGELVNHASICKKNGLSVTHESLPEKVKNRFSKMHAMPSKTSKEPDQKIQVNPKDVTVLSIMGMVGSWDSVRRGDIEAVQKFVDKAYNGGFSAWMTEIENMQICAESPITLENGIWKLKDRKLLIGVANGIFDKTLEAFSELVLDIAKERDPALDLPPEQRFASQIFDKDRKFSSVLRESVMEGLAILANNKNMLSNCSERGKTFSEQVVHSIMKSITCEDVCSLSELIKLIAESSPKIFLSSLEKAIDREPELFACVQEQEGTGVMKRNYIHHVIWALETLAWDPVFLSNAVSLLGSLAKVYEKSTGSRPLNSLTEIFLPWHPHTTATMEERIDAIRALYQENPETAWKLLLNLLPGNHQSSFGTSEPSWMNTVEIVRKTETNLKEYWDQIDQYTSLAMELGKNDPNKIVSLISQMSRLPQKAFDGLVEAISSVILSPHPDELKMAALNSLQWVSRRNKRRPEDEREIDKERLQKIDGMINLIKSREPFILYKNMFCVNNFDMYEGEDFGKEDERIFKDRMKAVKAIIKKEGVEGMIRLSSEVRHPYILGYSLGCIDDEYCAALLPEKIHPYKNDFVKGYVIGRFNKKKWKWEVFSKIDSWEPVDKVRFLSLLPFSSEILSYVSALNCELSKFYWKNAEIHPAEIEEETYEAVINSLIDAGRVPYATWILSSLLFREKKKGLKLDVKLIIKALLSFDPSDKDELPKDIGYDLLELIGRVQKDDAVTVEEKVAVEWKYLDLLDGLHGARPTTLEEQLSRDPGTFIYVINLLRPNKEENTELSTEQSSLALHAYKLLDKWKIPPGMDVANGFDADRFKIWLQTVKENVKEKRQIDAAMCALGKVLMHVPKDEDGFWINEEVAKILNGVGSDKIMEGLFYGYANSIQVYSVGEGVEVRMANKFNEMAKASRKRGYRKLANCMNDLKEYFLRMKKSENTDNDSGDRDVL